MNLSKSKDNGHKEEYQISKKYRYFDADVWSELDISSGDEKVVYTEDVLKSIDGEEEQNDESDSNNSDSDT